MRAGGKWTEARYWQFIRSALRRAFMRYPVKTAVLNENRKTVKGKRHKFEYQCASCKKWYMNKEVQVDHITPAGSLKSYDDLPQFVETLFCEGDNLQILCLDCHKAKTRQERQKC